MVEFQYNLPHSVPTVYQFGSCCMQNTCHQGYSWMGLYCSFVCTLFLLVTCLYCVLTGHLSVLCSYWSLVCTVLLLVTCLYGARTGHRSVLLSYWSLVCTMHLLVTGLHWSFDSTAFFLVTHLYCICTGLLFTMFLPVTCSYCVFYRLASKNTTINAKAAW